MNNINEIETRRNKVAQSQMVELWFDVKGHGEGRYQVSTIGRIRNTKTGRILKPQIADNGYMYVTLTDGKGNNKIKLVHRVVAESLLNNPTGREQVAHLDDDKTNNCVFNLYWMTAAENNNSGRRNEKIAKAHTGVPRYAVMKEVLELDVKTQKPKQSWLSLSECSKETGIPVGTISSCCNGNGKYGKGENQRCFIFARDYYLIEAVDEAMVLDARQDNITL